MFSWRGGQGPADSIARAEDDQRLALEIRSPPRETPDGRSFFSNPGSPRPGLRKGPWDWMLLPYVAILAEGHSAGVDGK